MPLRRHYALPAGRPARPEPAARSFRARRTGRSSDSRARRHGWRLLLAVASQAGRPSAARAARLRARPGRLSFPFTAAGQSRTRTGFPLASANLDGPRNQLHAAPYMAAATFPSTTCRAGVLNSPGRRVRGTRPPVPCITERYRCLISLMADHAGTALCSPTRICGFAKPGLFRITVLPVTGKPGDGKYRRRSLDYMPAPFSW
jgi:hypothetical protein